MLPSQPMNNAVDILRTHAKALGRLSLWHTRCMVYKNCAHLVFRQLCHATLRTTDNAVRACESTIAFLAHHVSSIVSRCSYPEMCGIATGWAISIGTIVQYPHAIRNRAAGQFPRCAMCTQLLRPNIRQPISIMQFPSCPYPTALGARSLVSTTVHLCPKAVSERTPGRCPRFTSAITGLRTIRHDGSASRAGKKWDSTGTTDDCNHDQHLFTGGMAGRRAAAVKRSAYGA